MKMAVIGTGNIGGTLVRRWTELGHDVTMVNSRGPESLKDLAAETGARTGSLQEVVRDRDVIVVTIPLFAVKSLPKDLFAEVPASTIVIDTCNYYPQRDGKIEEIESGLTESRWVERQLGRPVVKVFNNIYSKHLMEKGLPAGAAERISLPVSGDNAEAKSTVIALLDELGFDAVDVGGLDESWRHQPGTPCYGHDSNVTALKEDLASASPVRTAEWRA